ncbi:MAG: hypothetical protein ACK55Z_17230, partial [bacterium]
MRSGGPAAGTRGLNTFSWEAEADAASSAEKNETKTPVTKEQQQTIKSWNIKRKPSKQKKRSIGSGAAHPPPYSAINGSHSIV